MNKHHYVAITGRGIGSRFWPMSRTGCSKQFLDILNTGKTLIQSTYDRFARFIPRRISMWWQRVIVNWCKHNWKTFRQIISFASLPEKIPPPAFAYISYKLNQKDPEANLICTGRSPWSPMKRLFGRSASKAEFHITYQSAGDMGIKPTNPNTGYGYIQFEPYSVSDNVLKWKHSPKNPTAIWRWPSLPAAIFCGIPASSCGRWRTSLRLLKNYCQMNEVFDSEKRFQYSAGERSHRKDLPQCNISHRLWRDGEKPKTYMSFLLSAGATWTWASACETLEKDYLENAVAGDHVMVIDAMRNMVHAENDKSLSCYRVLKISSSTPKTYFLFVKR